MELRSPGCGTERHCRVASRFWSSGVFLRGQRCVAEQRESPRLQCTCGLTIEALPVASFIVRQPERLLEVLVIPLNAPAVPVAEKSLLRIRDRHNDRFAAPFSSTRNKAL